jgi:hypothetical protein
MLLKSTKGSLSKLLFGPEEDAQGAFVISRDDNSGAQVSVVHSATVTATATTSVVRPI